MRELLIGWLVLSILTGVFWLFAVDIYRAMQDRRVSSRYVPGSRGWLARRIREDRHPYRVRLWWAIRRAMLAPRGCRRLMFRYSWDNSGPQYWKGWRRDP